MRGVMSGWGGTRRGAKDSTFFQGLSQSSGLECNVRGLPTAFGYLSEPKKIEAGLCQRVTKDNAEAAQGKGEKTLTDPVIWTLSTGDDEDLASCPGNGDGAAHDPGCRTTFCRHDNDWVSGFLWGVEGMKGGCSGGIRGKK